MKKVEKIVINGYEALRRAGMGHQPHITGTGAHKDYKRDKKFRRQEDKRACRGD